MVKEDKKIRKLTTEQIERELNRVRYKQRYGRTFRSTIYALIIVAAMTILAATLFLPVFRIYGSSMSPTLMDGQIIISVKEKEFQTGDIIAFYYNNKILVKRVIANTGDWVDIDQDGNVYVNDEILDEPYVEEKAIGDCNIALPYQVPEGKIFVLGDHRSVSLDSRHTSVGCVSEDQIVGKLLLRIWPLKEITLFEYR